MTLPINITWSFVARVVQSALENGIDKRGEPELMRQIEEMGKVADCASTMLTTLNGTLEDLNTIIDNTTPNIGRVWTREELSSHIFWMQGKIKAAKRGIK